MPVREISPREALRLMGYTDGEIDRIEPKYTKTRLKKFAGDSVVVDVYIGMLRSIYGRK